MKQYLLILVLIASAFVPAAGIAGCVGFGCTGYSEVDCRDKIADGCRWVNLVASSVLYDL